MKKVLPGILLAFLLALGSLPAYAAGASIQIDGVPVTSDVKPETRNNRVMVPLRLVSENLGAQVNYSGSAVTLIKNDLEVTIKPNTNYALKNGKLIQLDTKPYVKNNRVMVPLRFIAETFSNQVNYNSATSTVTIDTAPLVIGKTQIKALQQEYHMTMGGVISQVSGKAYHQTFYELFEKNKGSKVDAPAHYSWMMNLDTPGSYYKDAQYDFLDDKGKSVQRYDIYSLIEAFPADTLTGFPKVLLYDATGDQWYLFSESASNSINNLIGTASKNGFLKQISNTVA